MRLVYKFNIDKYDELYKLCETSKNLYNQSLYLVKQELDKNNKWLFYSDLNKQMPGVTNLEGNVNYRLLKTQVSQQCLRTLDKDIKSYVKSIKDYSVNKENYKGVPQMPGYKHKVNQIVYTNQCSNIKNGYIVLSKTLKIKIPQYEKYKEQIKHYQQIRIIPKHDRTFTVEIVYNQDLIINNELNKNLYSSIDLGVNNLVTMILPDSKPILFNGKQVKSKNQYFNKRISKLQSCLLENKHSSKQIRKLYEKRDNQLTDIFHKLSRKIVNILLENKIGNLVVGYNEGWKDSIHLGHKNNQTFVYIPYDKLINYLKYKCEMAGINFKTVKENHTSKCDGLALESVEHHDSYLGTRKKRGLFQSSTGKLINADVNGALNILRNVVGDSEIVSRIINSGWLFQPLRMSILINNF